MKYINPVTGGSAIPTITTAMQLLPKGFSAESYRSTAGIVFIIVEGTGTVRIGEQQYAWTPHDVFVVPSWHSFAITASSDAVIFTFSDQIVQEKLDFFREERAHA